jgi:hypothetical protein
MFVSMLIGMLACEKEDRETFAVEGERNFSVAKEGDTLSVIIRTTQDYRVTAADNWCIILQKQPIGFTIQVNENTTLKERENTLTIESNIGEPIVLTITQGPGELFFRMDDAEKEKHFVQEGGTLPVVLQTNLEDYEVVAPSWCTVGEKSNAGFIVTAMANDDMRREDVLLIRAQGMADIEVKLTQNGAPFIKNPYMLDGNFEPWIVTRSGENIMVANTWIPGTITEAEHPDKARYTGVMIKEGAAGEGTISQTVTGIPDGTYTLTFTCQAGGSSTDGSDLRVVINGEEESIFAESRGGWKTIIRPVTVREGEVNIGLHAIRGTTGGLWFYALGFVLE